MKKSKFVMTAIAAAFAVSACGGALVACSDSKNPTDTPSEYQISFDANGGAFADGVVTTVTTIDGAIAALPAQDPTRNEYTFTGYTVNADGSGGAVIVGTTFTADATVYAQWKEKETEKPPTPAIEYTVTFDLHGGSFAEGTPVSFTTVNGKLAQVPSDPTKADNTFKGYALTDGGATMTRVQLAAVTFDKNTTVHAVWEDNGGTEDPDAGKFTVTFDLHGGSFAEGASLTYITTNGKLAAVPADPTKANSTFKGYALTEGGETITRTQLADVTFDKNTTVHAVWEDNGGTEDPDEDEYYYTVGGTKYKMTKYERKETDADSRLYEYQAKGVKLTAGDVVTFGFVGDENAAEDGSIEFWVSDEGLNACNGIEAIKSVKNSSVKAVNSGTFDIYVKWYADNGGSFVLSMSDGTASGVTDPSDEPAPEVEHEFYLYGSIGGEEKWSIEAGGYKFEKVTPDSGVWLQYSVTVTLAEGDRVKVFRTNAGAGENGWAYNNYEKSDWAYGKYEKYDTENPNNNDQNFVIKQSGKFTFYVKIYDNGDNGGTAGDGIEDGNRVWVDYKEIKPEVGISTITFHAGDGTLENTTVQTDKYGVLAELPVPTPPDGKEFDGWYTEPDGGVKVTVYKVYTEDTTLYAQYKGGDENLNPVVGATNGTTPIAITDNTANKPATPANLMYEYTSKGVELTEGDEISFTVDGEALTEFFTENCHGVTKVGTKFTVNETGTFDIYVRFYSTDPDTGAAPCWVIEINDGKIETLENGLYLAGTMSDFGKPSAQHMLADGAVTATLAADTAFKIVTVEDGKTDWTKPSYGYAAVTAGKGYVSADNDGNIVIKQAGTYTITLSADGKISITSEDVEEPEIIAYSAEVTFKDGVKATFVFSMPTWDGVDNNSAYIYIWNTDNDSPAVAWPGTNLSSTGVVEIDASSIDASKLGIIVQFKQSEETKQSNDYKSASIVDGGKYTLSIAAGNWSNGKFNLDMTKTN